MPLRQHTHAPVGRGRAELVHFCCEDVAKTWRSRTLSRAPTCLYEPSRSPDMSTPELRLPIPSSVTRSPRWFARVRAALPHGDALPAEEWARRHRLLLGLLWLHAV